MTERTAKIIESMYHICLKLEKIYLKEKDVERNIENMKTIFIGRGLSVEGKVLANGDVLDSDISVRCSDGVLLYESENVNTDPTHGYRGGILAEGEYYAIWHWHKGKYPALKIFNIVDEERLQQINRSHDLTKAERTLPSLVKNPNHNDECIIQDVNIHRCGNDSDWSHGCITILYRDWDKFIACFEKGEIVKVILS